MTGSNILKDIAGTMLEGPNSKYIAIEDKCNDCGYIRISDPLVRKSAVHTKLGETFISGYCSGCRTNEGNWTVISVTPSKKYPNE